MPWLAWHAVPVGNNTASPGLRLDLVHSAGNGVYGNTGLSIAQTGLITFASGQTFPGTGTGNGTITGITTTSPLTGSGTSGSVALSLNTSALETTLNGVYPQLSAATNTFAGNGYFDGFVRGSASGSGNEGIIGVGASGATAVYGSSDSGPGVNGLSGTGNGGSFSNSSVANATVLASNSAQGSSGNNPIVVEATASGDYVHAVDATTSGLNTRGLTAEATGNGSIGVYGESDGAVNGSTTPIGVKGVATGDDGNAMVADETGATGGYGLYAHATGVYDSTRGFAAGVYALGNNGYGVLGLDGGASATGNSTSEGLGAAGVWGDTNVPYTNTNFISLAGIAGTADNNYGGYFANNSSSSLAATVYAFNESSTSGALVFQAQGNVGGGHTCIIDGAANLSCSGTVSAVVKAADGAHSVETYAVQSPENWMEDFGTGTMERGVAVVKIDPAFAGTISGAADYHVFLTPKGDSNGLYVINETPTSFEVRESKGGTSSLSFDYRIVAKRRGYESVRLTDVTERSNALESQHQLRMEKMKTAPAPKTIVEPAMAPDHSRPAPQLRRPQPVPQHLPTAAAAQHIAIAAHP